PYPTEGSAGSGSIIDTRGYVVTNRHVIEGAFKIYVSLSDGTQYEGTVVGSDDQTDIAVVKFSPPAGMQLKTISFADSSNLKVGQKVIAIGNPFGFDRTMTTGIISSLGRPIQIDKNAIVKDMIQTDTAINPGNSGGPLLDSQGRMIGINTMIYSTSGSSAGVGFAVPVNTAKRIVSDLIQYGFVNRGSIDAVFVELNSTLANYAGLSINQGLLVSEITKNGNADKAGIKAGSEAVRYNRLSPVFYIGGDVITAVNGSKIHSLLDLNSILENSKPNEKVQVTIQRGRQSLTIPVTLAQKGK
ncbi:MAG TPA: trypsin-like peptidase domain-containing protein, partial [Treponemataceae bacterium]|nr:trypsin-like peptidase domain-containing protein [Treponemataceae bacterium]